MLTKAQFILPNSFAKHKMLNNFKIKDIIKNISNFTTQSLQTDGTKNVIHALQWQKK